MKRRIGYALLAGVLLLLLGLTVNKVVGDARYLDGYEAEMPLNAIASPLESMEDGYRRMEAVFMSQPGDLVPTVITLPETGEGPFPCVVFLHGIGQRKDFLDEITLPFNEAGFAMASFDQYMRGARSLSREASVFEEIGAFRDRAARTIIDTRRLVDYLETREEIDSERIYLVGASYGAITGATAAAFEPRYKATVLVYGGGGIGKLLNAPAIRNEIGPLVYLARPLAWYLMSKVDPLHYAGDIAPRPVLIQNGDHDQLISNASAYALQEACGEPKDIIWYESDHVGLDEAQTQQVLDDALDWLLEHDAGHR